jgi:CHAT domain-containing protein
MALAPGCANNDRSAADLYRAADLEHQRGDLKASLQKSERGMRQFPARTGSAWHWQFQVLCAENLISMARIQDANRLLEEAAGVQLPPALLARVKLDQAFAVDSLHDGARMRDLLRQAHALASQSGARAVLCYVELRLGDLAGKNAESLVHYQNALGEAEHTGDPYLLARAWLGLGFYRQRLSQFDAAVPFEERALKIAESRGPNPVTATALGDLGWCYFRLGDVDRAMNVLTRAEALAAQMGRLDDQHRWLGAIGDAYLAQGDIDRALEYHRRAESLARKVRNEVWLGVALHRLAETALLKGDLPAARNYNQEALQIERRIGNPNQLVFSELNQAKILAASGDPAGAAREFRNVATTGRKVGEVNVVWDAYGGLASLYRAAGRPGAAETEYRHAIETIDHEWLRLGGDDFRVTFLAPHLIRFFQDYVDFLIERGQPEKALKMAESSRARVLSQRLEKQGALPADFDLDRLVRQSRASRTVILAYWLAPRRSSVWVISSGRCSRFDLPGDTEIAALVRRYTETILEDGDPLARNDPAAASLYKAVLGPVQKFVLPGSDVIVVPDGALHQLNFETLVIPGPPAHYWIDDAAIATAPSLRVLRSDLWEPVRSPRLLLIGDPVSSGPEFPPLPYVKKEVTAVEGEFPAPDRTVYTGADACPERYAEAAPANFTTIHFAAHATANRESPLNSAIILSPKGQDYKLYARDVAAIPLHADLVTISACHSAYAKAYSGEGLMGFAWAFLQAGAQNVIASLWDVDDAGSVRIMQSLYAEIAKGQPPARALRMAKLALMRSGERYRRPYFWGPLEAYTRRIAAPAELHTRR